MKELIDKLVKVERDISGQKGSFLLFGLFLREDAPDLWDLLVAANWVETNKDESLKYISIHLSKTLTPDELIQLSRILIIESNNPGLEAIHKAIDIEHGNAEIKDSNLFGLQIKHAYVITSKREEAPETFEVILSKGKGTIRIEVRDITSGKIVLPEEEFGNVPYEKFQSLIKGLTFIPGKGYIKKVLYTEFRFWLSGFNGPKLELCIERVEEWIAKRFDGEGGFRNPGE